MPIPTLTRQARPSTFQVEAVNERGETVPTSIAGEHALTLYLDKRELVTLMTLGAAPEHLALGYLRNQRLVSDIGELAAVQVDWDTGSVAITSRSLAERGITVWDDSGRADALAGRLDRRTVTTGCGQGTVFGDLMEEIDRIALPASPRLTEETLHTVLDRVRRHESIYKVAGAVHGCALCSNAGDSRGEILSFVEDVGRHNAVDAIAGWMWLESIGGADKIFYTTGRLTSEMVIKCAQMGIPFLLSRSGLTQMGYEIAQRVGITMVGRCQGRHYLLFTGGQRFVRQPVTALA
ncbi:MAG: formate dehydrogenase accessory sulfurtransferase FdhD [Burkholderiaceae bacterium]|nr:formate dehydrogenase accessory sulfurtransferase FdhD [Burkholderiaceae bacterium]MEB2349889.1 formate dehydrogenase accessory sulfurtransferase FdhD [Burkholderiaceae bacterium]